MSGFTTGKWLGAVAGDPRDFYVAVFVPSQTWNGVAIAHADWRRQTIDVMASCFGGATAIAGEGGWRDDKRGGAVSVEANSTVFSLMAQASWNEEAVTRLGEFLRRMGRETSQGEIGVIVNGQYFAIEDFDE